MEMDMEGEVKMEMEIKYEVFAFWNLNSLNCSGAAPAARADKSVSKTACSFITTSITLSGADEKHSPGIRQCQDQISTSHPDQEHPRSAPVAHCSRMFVEQ